MRAYLVTASHEKSRKPNTDLLKTIYPFSVEEVEAIYPSRCKVPFASKMISLSKQRTGRELLPGELGCLMSHRKAWKKLVSEVSSEDEHVLIFESDSKILNPQPLQLFNSQVQHDYDLFFWGAWEGHMQFFRSKKKKIDEQYTMGEPFIKTVYCTYGYSLNKRAARLLLKRTARISHPVDQFKYFFDQRELKLGGILPEVITGNAIGSTIRSKENAVFKWLFLRVLDFKNALICACR